MNELNELKRQYNELLERGTEQYAKLGEMYKTMNKLVESIKELEGDDFDGVPLLFGSGFDIEEEL